MANGGVIGLTNPWNFSKLNQDKANFLKCWNFHNTTEVSIANWPSQLDDFYQQKLAHGSKGWAFSTF